MGQWNQRVTLRGERFKSSLPDQFLQQLTLIYGRDCPWRTSAYPIFAIFAVCKASTE